MSPDHTCHRECKHILSMLSLVATRLVHQSRSLSVFPHSDSGFRLLWPFTVLIPRLTSIFAQALQDDASSIFLDVIRNVGDEPRQAPAYPNRVSTTLYGRRYLSMIMDEAHTARKLNKVHTAACALRTMSAGVIAMTATPVMTKLQVSILPSRFQTPFFQSIYSRIFGSWAISWASHGSLTRLHSTR